MLAAVRTFGVDACVTRGSNTYGARQYPEKLIPLFVTNALDGEPLPLYGDGRQVRDWLHVDDHCAAIELVLRSGAPGEVFNVGSDDERENREVADRILELTGADPSLLRSVEDRPGHDRRYALDSLKLRADLDLAAGWSVGGSVVFASSQYAHGDENNRDVHGRVPGYAVIDVDARWRVAHDWEIFASIVNVLDRRYQNFAVLGANAFTGPDRSFGPALGLDPAPEQFRAVGAPRGIWIGVRYAFGFRQAGD